MIQIVPDTFQTMNFNQHFLEFRQLAALSQSMDGVAQSHRRLHQNFGLLLKQIGHRINMINLEALGEGINRINDVVQSVDQLVNVFAVKGRDKGLIQPFERFVGEIISLVLVVADALDLGIDIGELLGQDSQMLAQDMA